MSPVDWIILAILAASVLGGLSQGFVRSAFALVGLVAGLVLGAWNYSRLNLYLLPLCKNWQVADALGFSLIVFVVMAVAAVLGFLLSKTAHKMGLGCLDRLAGAVFGLLQGFLLVTLGIIAIAAFFPPAHWVQDARLPKILFGFCHLSTSISPEELSERLREGLKTLEAHSPEWLRPGSQ